MEAVDVAKKLQKLKGVDSDDEDKVEERPERRKTVHTLAKMGRKQYQATSDLEKAFKRRLGKFSSKEGNVKIIHKFLNIYRSNIYRLKTQIRVTKEKLD